MLKIVTVPNPILTQPVHPVTHFDTLLAKLVSQMEQTLVAQKDPEGVGLAAPQVGKNLSLFIIKPTKKDPTEVFINPKILQHITTSNVADACNTKHKTSKKTKKRTPLEGCLSIPRIWGPIRRSHKILLEYQGVDGKTKQERFTGFKTVIIEHEMDHLNGILFTQRAIEQNSQLFEEKEGKLIKIEY